MTNSLSLGPVLDLIERWLSDVNCWEYEAALQRLTVEDIAELKRLAEQHAAQLREISQFAASTLFEVGLDHEIDWHCAVAADFLSPRREPEAE